MTATLAPTTHWSAASADTGWQATPANRAAVTAAASRMQWTDQPHRLPQLRQPSVRALAAAIFFGRLDQLHAAAAGTVDLDGRDRTLIGLADDRNRYYLLDLGDLAVYVLHESRTA
jgi:hypothetical protein